MATSPVSLLISAGDSTERSGVMNPSTNWMSQPTITYLETTLPSDYLFTEEDDEFYINPNLKIVIIIFLSFMIVSTVIGNILVCLSVILVPKLRLPSNYLLVSLAISDLCVAILVMPLALQYELSASWSLTNGICDLWVSFDVTCCTSSILNLCTISIDRYLTITKPLTYGARRTTKRILSFIAAVWIGSVLISIPPVLMLGNEHGSKQNPTCQVSQNIGYQLYATLGAFYIPLLVMIVMYYKIYVAAKRVVEAELRDQRPAQTHHGFKFGRSHSSRHHNSVEPQLRIHCNRNKAYYQNTSPAGKFYGRNASTTLLCPNKKGSHTSVQEVQDDDCGKGSMLKVVPKDLSNIQDSDCAVVAHNNNKKTTKQRINLHVNCSDSSSSAESINRGIKMKKTKGVSKLSDHLDHSDNNSPVATTTSGDVVKCCTCLHSKDCDLGCSSLPPQPQQQPQSANVPETAIQQSPDPSGESVIVCDGATVPELSSEGQRSPNTKRPKVCSTNGNHHDHHHHHQHEPHHIPANQSTVLPPPPAHKQSVFSNISRIGRKKKGFLDRSSASSQQQHTSMDYRRRASSALRERKASFTLGIIMTAFTVCWLPFFILALIRPFSASILEIPRFVNSVALWLGYANSMLNPIIYVTFHKDFRSAFKYLLCFRCATMRSRLRAEAYENQYGAERKRRPKVKVNAANRSEFDLHTPSHRSISSQQHQAVERSETSSGPEMARDGERKCSLESRQLEPMLKTCSTLTNTTTTTSAMISNPDRANLYYYYEPTSALPEVAKLLSSTPSSAPEDH